MRNEEIQVISQERMDGLKRERDEKRRYLYEELPQKTKEARKEGGEIKENILLQAVQMEREQTIRRIAELDDIIRRSKVIQVDEINDRRAGLYTFVTARRLDTGNTVNVELVSPAVVELEKNQISTDSPFGRAVLGCRPGDKFVVETPDDGEVVYELMATQRNSMNK